MIVRNDSRQKRLSSIFHDRKPAFSCGPLDRCLSRTSIVHNHESSLFFYPSTKQSQIADEGTQGDNTSPFGVLERNRNTFSCRGESYGARFDASNVSIKRHLDTRIHCSSGLFVLFRQCVRVQILHSVLGQIHRLEKVFHVKPRAPTDPTRLTSRSTVPSVCRQSIEQSRWSRLDVSKNHVFRYRRERSPTFVGPPLIE